MPFTDLTSSSGLLRQFLQVTNMLLGDRSEMKPEEETDKQGCYGAAEGSRGERNNGENGC